MTERLCKDCKHFESEPDPNALRLNACYALKRRQHPVFGGEVNYIDAGLMRMTLCGWNDPKFWESKPKPKAQTVDEHDAAAILQRLCHGTI